MDRPTSALATSAGGNQRAKAAPREAARGSASEEAAEDAGQGAADGDPDLDRGQELVHVVLERLHPGRGAAAFRDQALDAAAAGGDDRDLAAREEAVAEEQQEDRGGDEEGLGHGLGSTCYQTGALPAPPCSRPGPLIACRLAPRRGGGRPRGARRKPWPTARSSTSPSSAAAPAGTWRPIRAAQMGLKTAVVERDPAGCGGTCLQRGLHPHQGPPPHRGPLRGLQEPQGVRDRRRERGPRLPRRDVAQGPHRPPPAARGSRPTSSRRTRSPSSRGRGASRARRRWW